MADVGKKWRFSIWDATEDDRLKVSDLIRKARYAVWVYDPEAVPGKIEMVGYFVFKHPLNRRRLDKYVPRATWMKSTFMPSTEASNVMRNPNLTPEEYGNVPLRGQTGGNHRAWQWDKANQLAMQGRFDEIPRDIYERGFKRFKHLHEEYQRVNHMEDE